MKGIWKSTVKQNAPSYIGDFISLQRLHFSTSCSITLVFSDKARYG